MKAKPTKSKGLNILVIEDNADHQILIRDILEGFGINVFLACSLAEGEDILSGHPEINAAIVDLNLPDTTGNETIRRVVAKHWALSGVEFWTSDVHFIDEQLRDEIRRSVRYNLRSKTDLFTGHMALLSTSLLQLGQKAYRDAVKGVHVALAAILPLFLVLSY